jgi:hypothetical protein
MIICKKDQNPDWDTPIIDPDVRRQPVRPVMAMRRPKFVIDSHDTDEDEGTSRARIGELAFVYAGILLGLLAFAAACWVPYST